jgi:hypothetical protein
MRARIRPEQTVCRPTARGAVPVCAAGRSPRWPGGIGYHPRLERGHVSDEASRR